MDSTGSKTRMRWMHGMRSDSEGWSAKCEQLYVRDMTPWVDDFCMRYEYEDWMLNVDPKVKKRFTKGVRMQSSSLSAKDFNFENATVTHCVKINQKCLISIFHGTTSDASTFTLVCTLFEIFIFCPKIQLWFPEKMSIFWGEKLVKMLWVWTF